MDIGGDGVEQNEGDQPPNLNISDVLDAIVVVETSNAEGAVLEEPVQPQAGGVIPAGGATQTETMSVSTGRGPYVRIVEQPASKALRFRYICEGRSAGSIPGVSSTQDRRTYPTIEICNYIGKVIIVVSCVTKDQPYRPHPHNLVGRDHCNKGVCSMKMDVTPENRLVSFSNLGIQCVKKRDIGEALKLREAQRVDPFRTGFGHSTQSIDLNAVRLCFQVFVEGSDGECRRGLHPVVSDIIYDKKAMSDLHILRTSCTSGSVKGDTEVILLCEKVTREDTAVVMYKDNSDGTPEWEGHANIIMVHKQVAIAFTTPPYRDTKTRDHVKVHMQLKRVNGNERSNSIPFLYVPEHQDMDYLKRKRQKTDLLQQIEQERSDYLKEQVIKSEPSEKGSPLHMGSSPARYNTLEPVLHENPFNQHWMQDIGVPPNMNFNFNPDVQWPGPSYQVPMQVPSPNMQARPNMPVTSPNITVKSPQGHVMSPQGHVMQDISRQGHAMQSVSPGMQMLSPQGRVMSPQGQIMSPQCQVMSPQGQMLSPQCQVMSPQGQMMSPQGQVMSPQGHMMSPQGQVMSPQGHMMSPHLTVDTDRGGVSPGMGHISSNMGHVSPALQQQPMVQPMEQNSVSSMTNYLMDRGGDNFNSGEIAAILGLRPSDVRDPPNDLSDSLNRLSTSDLLNPQL